jgi:hypothetical protein
MVMHCKNSKKLQNWPLTLILSKRYHISLWWHVLLDCAHLALPIDIRFTCMSHRCINNEKYRVSCTPLLIINLIFWNFHIDGKEYLNISLLKILEEQNIIEEIIQFENYKFQENDTGIELAESQFSKILENLARHSCKLVKSFKKNKNSKKKPWVDRELSGLTKTVIKLGSALKKQPLVQLKNNFLKYSKECKKLI